MDYSNQTVLVTGASSGIGATFARQLAESGANLVLVARRGALLEKLASELRERHGARVDVFVIDLTSSASVSKLAAELDKKEIDVDVLINNAGFATSGLFIDEDLNTVDREIALNVNAVVSLTRTFLPGMISRGTGAVVNLASTAAFQPVPTMAVYGATKAFVLSFTEAVWAETQGTGVRVLALCPGATDTEFFEIAGSGGTGAKRETPASVVQVAMRELSLKNQRPTVISGSRNAIVSRVPRFVSRAFMSRLSLRVMSSD